MQVSPAQTEQLEKSLTGGISGDVLASRYDRALYATDASLYQIEPLAVVLPRNVADVQHAVRIAAEHAIPLIPRGGGTSLSGQAVGRGIVIDFSKYMDRIVEIDTRRRIARVEPGVVLDVLNAAAARHGLCFGPDVSTSSHANLGGMIGNNSAGSRSILHGKTVDHVMTLDVCLADGSLATLAPRTAAEIEADSRRDDLVGQIYRTVPSVVAREREEIVRRFPRLLRRVSGYNLDEFVPELRRELPAAPTAKLVRAREAAWYGGADFNLVRLVVGSEGTLATVVGAEVHLVELPAARGLLVLEYSSLAASVAGVAKALELGPSAVELFDGLIVRLAERNLAYRDAMSFVRTKPDSLLLVEMSGEADDVEARLQDLAARLVGSPGLLHAEVVREPARVQQVWACRKAALPLLMGIPGARKPIAFVEDTAVDPARLPEFVARFQQILARAGTQGAYYGHASVGCLHIRPLLDASNRDDLARLLTISREVADLVLEFGGAMSGEHGDGLARSYLNQHLFGPRIYRAFQEVKAAFDPAGIMNPGKIVDGPSPIENLRSPPERQGLTIVTGLDFSREGGLRAAAELCNGSGVCRKTQTGTMCPSFMATRDEEHSTRGRANSLRLVLSGALPPEELAGEQMLRTYDLCLQCKGCKAECPSNVDVAKLKVEVLHQHYLQHGVPRSARWMADVARTNRWGSALAPLSNWAARLPFSGAIAQRLLGIDARRPLPTFERNHFRKWLKGHSAKESGERGPVVLLDDCLTSYCEPNVNRSAVELLERAGYEVELAGFVCCGRPYLSKGLVYEARRLATANLERLRPWIAKGTPIVGCEPSCVAMLKDDYFDLVPGELTKQAAELTHWFESFLGATAGLSSSVFRPAKSPILIHGHCHQKALSGTAGITGALGLIPEAKARVVDSGCCGMAGSFGYEHYDVSMQIGERVLFPAVREAVNQIIVAPGFSCRHQIEHGTGRRALHPAEVLVQHLK